MRPSQQAVIFALVASALGSPILEPPQPTYCRNYPIKGFVDNLKSQSSGTAFCSAFLGIPVVTSTISATTTVTNQAIVTTATVIVTPLPSVVTAATSTITACPGPVAPQGHPAKRGVDRLVIPQTLKGQLTGVISSVCSCISIPTSTTTTTVTSSILTTNTNLVTATTTLVPVTNTITPTSTVIHCPSPVSILKDGDFSKKGQGPWQAQASDSRVTFGVTNGQGVITFNKLGQYKTGSLELSQSIAQVSLGQLYTLTADIFVNMPGSTTCSVKIHTPENTVLWQSANIRTTSHYAVSAPSGSTLQQSATRFYITASCTGKGAPSVTLGNVVFTVWQ